MDVRILKQHEILPALHLIWEVFAEDVAPAYTPEGVAHFQEFIKYDNISDMYQKGEITFFGAFEGTKLCGTMAVKSVGHICLFYVRKDCQGKGIGRMLFQAVYNYCAQKLGVSKITVNAAPGAVPKYAHMGMQAIGEEQQVNGIRYVPMEMQVIPGLMQPVKEKSKAPVIIVTAVCIAMVLVLIIAGVAIGRKVRHMLREQDLYTQPYDHKDRDHDYDDHHDYDYFGDDGAGQNSTDAGELTGIDAIPQKIADGLSYDLEEDAYTYQDDKKQTTLIEFNVNYPVISGLKDAKAEEKVNEALKNCALQTVDKIYDNPSDEMKERVLSSSQPALVSYVKYKVTYASEDLLSVAFEDYSYQGGAEYSNQDLRTCNISLKDGRVYEVKDIIRLDDAFLAEWADIMRDEADNDAFLSELDKDAMKKTLEGDSLDGVYEVNFFLDADGIEIGYNLNYKEGDANNLGYIWVTAPFDYDEIAEFRTDSDFWTGL